MKITILGSGTLVPNLARNSAGVLLESDGTRSLIDFGYGNVHQLLRLGITYHDIDRIYFTHHHPDHMCDLIYFLFSTRYPQDPRRRSLEIVAGPGFKAYFDKLMDAFNNWLVPKTYPLEILEQDEETRQYGDLQVTTKKVAHIEISRGFRFTDPNGKTMAISGDTDYSPGMVELGKNADLMILECSMPDDLKIIKHLTPTLCGQMARESGCQTLCLTHFYPPCDMADVLQTCQRQFSGKIILAQDLTVIDL